MNPVEELKAIFGAAGCVLIPALAVCVYCLWEWLTSVKRVAESIPERQGSDKAVGCYGTFIGILAAIVLVAFLVALAIYVPEIYREG